MSTDFWDVVSRRCSVRSYRNERVPASVLDRVLRAAVRAPSAHNGQPWHFAVISSDQVRARLIRRMAERYDHDLRTHGVPEKLRARRTRRSIELMGSAPVVIVAYLGVTPGQPRGSADRDADRERIMGIQSVAAAVGTLLLAASASGLGACWYSAPLYCADVVHELLPACASWEPQALVTLGYPAESAEQKPRKTLEEVATYVP